MDKYEKIYKITNKKLKETIDKTILCVFGDKPHDFVILENTDLIVETNKKSKFNSEDLGIEPIENQIKNEILEIIKKNIKNIRFLGESGIFSDLPTPRFEIYNGNEEWLFDINYNEETKHFCYSYYRIIEYFKSKYEIGDERFSRIMMDVIKEDLKMEEMIPTFVSF